MSGVADTKKPPQNGRLTCAFLYASLGEKILDRLASDDSFHGISPEVVRRIIRDFRDGELKREDFSTQGDFMAQVVTPVMQAFLEQACPTFMNKPQIMQWVCNKYLSHGIAGRPMNVQDLHKIGENIVYFNYLKDLPSSGSSDSPDLMQYKTYAAFEAMLAPHLWHKEQREREERLRYMSPEKMARILAETTVLYDGPDGQVVVPHTLEASKYWGNNTRWCLAGEETGEKYFPKYNEVSPVIMILPRGQPDNKVALVNNLVYSSADEVMRSYPDVHRILLQNCLTGLSEGARRGIAPWIRIDPDRKDGILREHDPLAKVAKDELANLRLSEEPKPDASLWNNRAFVLAAARLEGGALEYAPEKFRHDREIVLAAAAHFGNGFEYAADELKGDRAFVMEVVGKNGSALKYAVEGLKEDRDVVLAAVRQDADALQYASDELRQDREVVMAAVAQSGIALGWAADELKQDRAFVLEAVRINGFALGYAAEEIRNDREVVLAAVQQEGGTLQQASDELRQDREVVMAAVAQSGIELRYAGGDLQRDPALVMEAVRQNGMALQYAADGLQREREFILAAVGSNGKALNLIPEEQQDREIVLRAVFRTMAALSSMRPEEFRNDPGIVSRCRPAIIPGSQDGAWVEL